MKLSWLLPAVVWAPIAQASPEPLVFLSEQNAPVNYEDSSRSPAGFSVELLHLMWQQMSESPKKIHFFPWARAYYIAQTKTNTVLFATSRTPDRENMFKWVCPISESNVVLVHRKTDRFNLASAINPEKVTIGVVRADIAEEIVIAKMQSRVQLIKAGNIEQTLQLLKAGKVDMIAAYEPVLYNAMERLGVAQADYKKDMVLQRMTDCYAFNRSTSDSVILQYQQALTAVRQTPKYAELKKRYPMLQFQ